MTDPIESTVALLRTTFPDRVRGDILPLLRALYDHMSDRQLAAAISAWLGVDAALAINDVWRAAALDPTNAAVQEVIAQLEENGFSEWCEED